MDFANSIAQWMLSQIETLPVHHLSRGLELAQRGQLIDRFMSEREAAEIRALLNRPPSDHPHSATVLIPGIMGSLLASIRGISAILWPNAQILLDGHLNLLDLGADGVSDLCPDVEIVPLGIEKLTYLQAVLTLARETRLYEFPYDWRRSILHSARELSSALERWSMNERDRRYTLVCHSMGGLVARAYLTLHPRQAERNIARVIMLGTPLQGAVEAALVFAGDTLPSRVVRELHPENDVVRFAANIPSTYQLLPPPPEMFRSSRPYPMSWDPYDRAAWGLDHVRGDLLDTARKFHEKVSNTQPDVEQIEIAGCHVETVTDVRQETEGKKHLVGYDAKHEPGSGDGQVPLWSTTLPEVTTYYVQTDHQKLASQADTLEAVLELIHGEPISLSTQVPEKKKPEGPLEAVIPFVQQVSELRQRLSQGTLTKEDLQRILFAR